MSTSFTVGMGQMLVEANQPERNLERAAGMIRRAAELGCAFIVLPECLDFGWTHPAAVQGAAPVPGPCSDALCRAAADAGIYVAAGLTERCGNRIYNAAVLVSPAGQIILKHRKINVLTIAQDIYSTGTSLGVADTEYGVVGLNICADNFSSSLALGHSIARMGAELLLSPCAWAVDADHDNEKQPYGAGWREAYGELARLYDITVIGVSNVGPITAGVWAGRKCIGCSLAVGPGGAILAQAPYGADSECLVPVEVRRVPRPAAGTGWAEVLRNRGYDGP